MPAIKKLADMARSYTGKIIVVFKANWNKTVLMSPYGWHGRSYLPNHLWRRSAPFCGVAPNS
jgi:hypothetical protein